MCEICIRRSRRLGLPKGKFGKTKFWAHRLARRFGSCPLFRDRRFNVAVEAHVERILRARTFRPKTSKGIRN